MAKGIAYEKEVAAIVAKNVADGSFGLDPSCAAIRHQPAYFSRDRQKDIVFDVSIEVSRRGATSPYIIWLWECKNYDHKVPVDDVEEFHAKLSQIGVHRAKGSMITPMGFDSGALEFARSKGIGLWRYIPQGSLVLIMEDDRRVVDADVIRALTTQDTTMFRSYSSFYGLACKGEFFVDQIDLLKRELTDSL